MEESFVLDVGETWVVEVIAKHKCAGLKHNVLLYLVLVMLAVFQDFFFFVRNPADCILARLLIKLTLH